MGDIGTPIVSGAIPAVGSSGTAYATNLNLFLTEVKARLEAEVPKTALASGNLDMDGSALQNASYLGIEDGGSAPTTPSNSFQAFGGDVYWVNTGGAVQITNGTSLNTSLLGGITGDYGGANPAQFRFVDADQEYYAYDDFAGGAWARVWARNFDIAAGATSAFRARLAFGGGASYTLTLPSAVPASTSLVTMASSGQLAHTTGFTRTVQVGPLEYQTAVAAWQHIGLGSYWESAASGSIWIPMELPLGATLNDISIRINKVTTSAQTLTLHAFYMEDGTPVEINSNSNNGNSTGLATLSVDCTEVVAANRSYFARLTTDGGNGDLAYTFTYEYSEPVTVL